MALTFASFQHFNCMHHPARKSSGYEVPMNAASSIVIHLDDVRLFRQQISDPNRKCAHNSIRRVGLEKAEVKTKLTH